MSFWSNWSDGKKWAMGIVGAFLVAGAFGAATRLAALLAPRTDPWWESQQWRIEANDQRFGWEETSNQRSDHKPATMDRKGVLVLHPIGNPGNPAVVRFVGSLEATVATLTIEISGATEGDSEVRVYAGGVQLTPSSGSARSETGNVIDGRRWYTLTFDVRKLSRVTPDLELRIYGGGAIAPSGESPLWWYETVFIDSISLS
jgi:hypothetical protein